MIRSGRREQVFVLRAPGQYEPRPVTLGVTSDGLVQITDGIKAGEQVVVSGQFLIDSESKLREVSAKMQEPKAPPAMPAGHDMSTMEGMDKTEAMDKMEGMDHSADARERP